MRRQGLVKCQVTQFGPKVLPAAATGQMAATPAGVPSQDRAITAAVVSAASAGSPNPQFATIARSQLAGIGAGIAISFGEQFATIFLPDVVKYLPFHVADAILAPASATAGGGGAIAARLDPSTALVLVVVWLVGALAVSGAVTERADIGG